MTTAPFFSILIPSYNRPLEIRNCVQSILRSTCTDFEIVVSDDKSPKMAEIRDALEDFEHLPNFRVYYQKSNLREPRNKNFLVGKAKGKFNIIIADDDELERDALEKIQLQIAAHPNFDIYGLGYRTVDENSNETGLYRSSRFLEVTHPNNIMALFGGLTLPLWFFHPSTFCCRAGVEISTGYSIEVGIGEDLFFLLLSALNGKKICALPMIAFSWRKVKDASAVGQPNQSLQSFSSVMSKIKIRELLLKSSHASSNKKVLEYLRGVKFPRRFLLEEIRHAQVNAIDAVEWIPDDFGYPKLVKFEYHRVYVLNRIYKLVELFKLVGPVHALSLLRSRW